MGGMTPETRCKVPVRYQEMFEKELKEVMKSECGSRDFGTALQFLAVSPHVAECDMIEKACQGMGTNEQLLSTLIVGRSNEEMELLKKTYFDIYTEDMGRKLDGELGGSFEQLIVNCLQASEEVYDADFHGADDKAKEDAQELYDMGQGQWGTNEQGLFKKLCAMPPEHLQAVNDAYAEEYGYTIPKVMEKEFGGDSKFGACLLVNMKLHPYVAVANLIQEAVEGFGTNELLLTCILIRYQAWLKEVKPVFEEQYGKPLEDVIQSETGGDYETILMQIVATADEL